MAKLIDSEKKMINGGKGAYVKELKFDDGTSKYKLGDNGTIESYYYSLLFLYNFECRRDIPDITFITHLSNKLDSIYDIMEIVGPDFTVIDI